MASITDMRTRTLTERKFLHPLYDVVERRRTHQRAYFLYMENALTGICITRDEKILSCNRRFTEIFGFSREELHGMQVSHLIHSDSQRPTREDSREADGASPPVREVNGLTKDGRIIITRQTVSELQYEDRRLVILHVMDITDQKAIEDTLRDSERERHLLSQQVLETLEIERRRVASELHDGIGQILSSIKFGLENTFREVSDNRSTALTKLAGTVSSIRAAIEEVRRISMDLRPAMLDDLGIEPTIEWLCREYQVAHPSIRITKRIDLRQVDVGDTLTVSIFRILQEALNNIAKHAHATRVYVSLKAGVGELALSIEDNGRGFIADKAGETGNGFGLYSMKERARLSGGRLRIDSVAGAGTRIAATWPYNRALDLPSGACAPIGFAAAAATLQP